jgi:hypothetical protein
MKQRPDSFIEGVKLVQTSIGVNPVVVSRMDELIGSRQRSAKIRELIANFVKAEEQRQQDQNPAA